MSSHFISPILYQYEFLEELCSEAAALLFVDKNNLEKYKQLKHSIFLNFNRYLVDSLILIPNSETGDLFEKLTLCMQAGDETETLRLLNSHGDLFVKIRSEFILIMNNSKNNL